MAFSPLTGSGQKMQAPAMPKIMNRCNGGHDGIGIDE